MKETIYKGTDFLSIEETLGSIVTRMGLVSVENHNDSEPSDSALCDFTIEVRRKHNYPARSRK